ncbi:MAG: hypothetical protein HY921_02330 [Elusimicrobia bacterium]|nr:hypothetical protein [Elusimicrobiota bacterium]
MNRVERDEWLRALLESFPALECGELKAFLGRLDEVCREGSWELMLSSIGPAKKLGFRYGGGSENYASWSAAAARVLGLSKMGPRCCAPAPGFPWLELVWDPAADRFVSGSVLSAKSAGQDRAFSPGMMGHPELKAAFAALHRLHPVASMARSADWWAVRFAEPLSWPSFLALDISAPFAGHSSLLSFLLLNRRVSELKFTEDELWACAGK